ncbi:TPA: GntR family transcriptional regulator [Escherichia coli]|nr:GntR family transcriptional regulator [Escherichia coli]HBZ8229053.1 GntR family transcriptional regulator [Escherichia coli]HBZ8345781.1 GntR family transcriptional regulator [Escherichia coli]HBZ8350850.1 GntR family transcriptional regulator [Escherichia coli]HBZ8356182.1 GntR family transcriptional regulator [Escherichia coli]
MKTEIEYKIASELNAGTELSERKLAEKFNVTRSVVQRVKRNIEKYTIEIEIKAEVKEEPKVADVVEVETKEVQGIDNIEKLLKSKSAHKKPSSISLFVFKRSEGDFALFSKHMLGKSKQYIKDQFLRCMNKDSK